MNFAGDLHILQGRLSVRGTDISFAYPSSVPSAATESTSRLEKEAAQQKKLMDATRR